MPDLKNKVTKKVVKLRKKKKKSKYHKKGSRALV